MEAREYSFDILKAIEQGEGYARDILHLALKRIQFSDKRDRAFVTRLVEGVTERRITLDYIIEKFSKGKNKNLKEDFRILLRMGIYQIHYMDSIPNRAAISETVELIKKKGFQGLSGYANALLRNIAGCSEDRKLDSYLVSRLDVRFSTPLWICELLTKTYGKETAYKILSDQFESHDTVIRCNRLKLDVDELRDDLCKAGVEVKEPAFAEEKSIRERAIRISGYDSVTRLPGYSKGYFIVQDETSIYAVNHIGIKPGDKVLDMCASPGGKSLLAYELTNPVDINTGNLSKGTVISRDISQTKLERIKENAERLGIEVLDDESSGQDFSSCILLQERDATELDTELAELSDEDKMDVVIADVPCSGLGIIGRKNDIKYHMNPEAIDELAEQGLKILKNASNYVKRGGRICFSTCTINPTENQEVVDLFLSENGDGFKKVTERTFLQGIDGSDGFYFSIIEKCK